MHSQPRVVPAAPPVQAAHVRRRQHARQPPPQSQADQWIQQMRSLVLLVIEKKKCVDCWFHFKFY